MHLRIAAVAEADPERPALVEGDRRVTYGELWREVRRFAAALTSSGLTQGERVAIVLPNGIEAVVARYGTWRAGGVPVPLDVHAAARELGRWLTECEARFVVRAPDHDALDRAMQALPRPPEQVVWRHCSDTEPEPEPVPEPARRPWRQRVQTPGRLALVLYTSGRTRRPTGVMLSHGNLVANVRSSVAYLGLTDADSVVTTLPFYRSCGASVLHAHLSVGARLVVAPGLDVPRRLVETIARERVSGLAALPATFALLVARVDLAAYDLSALRTVTHGTGAMSPVLVRRVRAALPEARLFVTYGQTEAAAQLTWMPPDRVGERLGTVGVPVPGVRLEIRREGGERAAPGEVGEIWVTGDSVMIGLLKDPAGTRAAIREGWLDTGDMGHVDREGFVYVTARRAEAWSDRGDNLGGRHRSSRRPTRTSSPALQSHER